MNVPHRRGRTGMAARLRRGILCAVVLAGVDAGRPCAARAETFDPTNATYDELLFRATRYGNTEERRADKARARDELFARGDAALREVMARVHVENIMLQVLADEMARYRVPPDRAAAVLAEFIDNEDAQTRRTAVYLLGFLPGKDYVERVLPLLDDEKCRNAAIRTLGKWRVAAAREKIRGFLQSDNERTRVLACNALRDIGDPKDLPALLGALGDPVFTVRNTAARAVASFGRDAQQPLLNALPKSTGAARRQVIRLLGELRVRGAVRPLRRLLKDDDPAVRVDAALALRGIESARSRWWFGRAPTAGGDAARTASEPLFVP